MHGGEGFDLAQRTHLHATRLAHASEVVAHEVHDHHVLGAILGARRELRRLVLEQLAAISADENDYRSEARRLFGV